MHQRFSVNDCFSRLSFLKHPSSPAFGIAAVGIGYRGKGASPALQIVFRSVPAKATGSGQRGRVPSSFLAAVLSSPCFICYHNAADGVY